MQQNSDTASMRALHVKQAKKFTKGVGFSELSL